MSRPTTFLVKGRVRVLGWFGVHEFLVAILGETPKRWLVTSEKPWGLRSRSIAAGEVAQIPKHAVTVIEQRP